MDLVEQREHPRFWVNLPVMFSASQTPSSSLKTGSLFNLSHGGCAVATAANVTVGSMLTLFIQTDHGKLLLKVEEADVRWTTVGEFGLRFTRLTSEEQNRLRIYLSTPS